MMYGAEEYGRIEYGGSQGSSNVIYIIVSDGIKVGERLLKNTTKKFSDGLDVADSALKNMTKRFSDGLDIEDGVLKNITKVFSDGIEVADSALKNLTKIFSDGIDLADSALKNTTKKFTDGIVTEDSLIYKLINILKVQAKIRQGVLKSSFKNTYSKSKIKVINLIGKVKK